MDPKVLELLVSAAPQVGFGAVVLILWYLDSRRREREMKAALDTIREGFGDALKEIRATAEKSEERNQELLRIYREDTQRLLAEHKDSVVQVSNFYTDNVELVRNFELLSKQQLEVLLMVSQQLQRVEDGVTNNLYCPLHRPEKRAKGPQTDG